jgi:hypothetical protein
MFGKQGDVVNTEWEVALGRKTVVVYGYGVRKTGCCCRDGVVNSVRKKGCCLKTA